MRNSQLRTNPFLKRPPSPFEKTVTSLCLSLVLAFVIVGILLYGSGERAGPVFLDTITQGFLVGERWSLTLVKSIPIVFAGLSVSMAWGSGYYSMSTQGELLLGLCVASLVLGLNLSLPTGVLVLLALFCGAMAGMFLSLTTAWISHSFSTSLLMTTLMCNYIIVEIGDYFATGGKIKEELGWKLDESSRLGLIPLEWSVFFLALMTISIFYLKTYHTYGYHMKIRGFNHKFAHYGGVPEEKTLYGTLALSGSIGGLGGALLVVIGAMEQSYPFVLESSFALQGMTTGLMANYHPLGVLLTGMFFGGLSVGGDYVTLEHGISSSMIPIMQGIVALVVTAELFRFFERKKEGKRDYFRLF